MKKFSFDTAEVLTVHSFMSKLRAPEAVAIYQRLRLNTVVIISGPTYDECSTHQITVNPMPVFHKPSHKIFSPGDETE